MATSSTPKKVVQATNDPPAKTSGGGGSSVHQTAPENRSKGNQFRLIAIAFWVVAIVIELFLIFGLLLKKGVAVDPAAPNTKVYPFLGMSLSQNAYFAWIVILIIVCGILSVIGSQFWKRANRLDPASEKDKVRFFVQNQLGAIIAMIAFIPILIIVILDKNLQGAQKGIAVAVAAIVLGGTTLAGAEFNPSSIENQSGQQQLVDQYGQPSGTVYWVKGGSVYHLCQASQDFSSAGTDANPIYSGTLDQAINAGKTRLAYRNECNFDNSNKAADSWQNGAQTSEPTSTDTP